MTLFRKRKYTHIWGELIFGAEGSYFWYFTINNILVTSHINNKIIQINIQLESEHYFIDYFKYKKSTMYSKSIKIKL